MTREFPRTTEQGDEFRQPHDTYSHQAPLSCCNCWQTH